MNKSRSRHTLKWPINLHEMLFGVKRYYVHEDIVDWLTEVLTPLCEEGTVSIVDIYHTPIYDDINCIEFYSDVYSSDGHTNLGVIFNDINDLLMYKIRWVSNATYFIEIDQHFNKHLKQIIEELKKLSFWHLLQTTYEMEINWFQINRIQVLQFKEFEKCIEVRIDQIFREVGQNFNRLNALYIADPLPWHAYKYSFRPMDTLSWEICGEEWSRHNLLDDFSLSDLLAIDMANKDFRDPYFDGYMDRYVNLLVERKIPFSIADDNTKVDCLVDSSLNRLWSVGYFMYKFRHKFSTVFLPDLYWDPERAKLKDIFSFRTEYNKNKAITLCANTPDPNTLTEFESMFRKVHYTLENYRHFSDDIFRKLISLPKNSQRFTFNFRKNFIFMPPLDVKPISNSYRTIEIHLKNCRGRNTSKLGNFLRYLIKLFKHYGASEIHFEKCEINDYAAFKNIGDSFRTIQFDNMRFTKNDLVLLIPCITSKTMLEFMFCHQLTDNDVYEICVSSHISVENLSINHYHSCTCLVIFMLADFFMKQYNVQTFKANRLPHIAGLEQFTSNYYEYYVDRGQIRLRFIDTLIDIDIYYLLNGTYMYDEEPPFDYN